MKVKRFISYFTLIIALYSCQESRVSNDENVINLFQEIETIRSKTSTDTSFTSYFKNGALEIFIENHSRKDVRIEDFISVVLIRYSEYCQGRNFSIVSEEYGTINRMEISNKESCRVMLLNSRKLHSAVIIVNNDQQLLHETLFDLDLSKIDGLLFNSVVK